MRIRTHSVITLLCAATASLLIAASPARAGYIVTLEQVGPNVVATGSGALDLTAGVTLVGSGLGTAGTGAIIPNAAHIETGAGLADQYENTGPVSAPTNFGSGIQTIGNSSSGDFVAIFPAGGGAIFVVVPAGYMSGAPLSDTATYDSTNFTMLGVTPGTYKWSWGTGANQNFTLKIGAARVPDQGSSLTLLGIVLLCWLGFDLVRRRVINA